MICIVEIMWQTKKILGVVYTKALDNNLLPCCPFSAGRRRLSMQIASAPPFQEEGNWLTSISTARRVGCFATLFALGHGVSA